MNDNLNIENLEYKNFNEFVQEKLREKNLNLKRLSELSGISLKNLENLLKENFNDLPAMPYIRGYLINLGKILNFDYEYWWDYFKNQQEIKKSGLKDELPKNRFKTKFVWKPIFIILILIIIAFYLIFRFNFIFGKPSIEVNIPNTLINVNNKNFIIYGKAISAQKVFINNQEINLAQDGSFQKEVILEPGLNTFEISAQKVLGGKTTITRQIFYQEIQPLINSTNTQNF